MIITLTLNPCIDRTITVEKFLYGGTNKVTGVRNDVSGKGINVSTVLKNLGMKTMCLGFNYSDDAQALEKSLENQGIAYDFVGVEGKLRINVKIFDSSQKVMSKFNESGHWVPEESVEELLEKLNQYWDETEIMVLDGSVPQGVPKDIYRRIIEKANEKGIKTILDAANELLAEGIKGKPYLIKPNIDEFSAALGRKMENPEEIIEAARAIIRAGVSYVCVSMGEEGAWMVSKDKALFAPPLKLDIKGIQGAGDSLVAGICMAIRQGKSMEDMLRYAVAAAGGSLLREGTQLCVKEDFERLLEQVMIKER